MAYTSPITWTVGQLVTAAQLNSQIRDNWLALFGTTGALVTASNTLGASVPLNNTASYFDGPSMAQGTAGVWYVSGTIEVMDTAGAASIEVKLWDGATIIASAYAQVTAASVGTTVALSGILTSPSGNIRISARDSTSTSGAINANASGLTKDSTIWGVRIG